MIPIILTDVCIDVMYYSFKLHLLPANFDLQALAY
ncbi:protein of unknown function [Acidithiobacillus ferrivorans]|uniref:Uncharacterized protein n=1 Tax=Acidithiobacillus ferrivorans TaxID=160808 RepID=A0ABY1MTL9_9PROT|nr:protein of unknown function [Acidithiobacillus ferrivorans]